MIELFEKLTAIISDPVVVAVIAVLLIALIAIWKLFGKQHQFILERLDLLRKENNDLRSKTNDLLEQISILKSENEKLQKQTALFEGKNRELREISLMLLESVEQIKNQPVITGEQFHDFAEKYADIFRQFSESFYDTANMSMAMQENSFSRLIEAIKNGQFENREIIHILNDLIEIVGQSQKQVGENIEQLKHRTKKISDKWR